MHPRAGHQRYQEAARALEHVVKGQNREEDVVRPGLEWPEHGAHVGRDVPVREHHPLGRSRRSGRERYQREIVRPAPGARQSVQRRRYAGPAPPLIEAQHPAGGRHVPRQRAGPLPLPGVRHEANGLRLRQNVREFPLLQAHVQRHEDAPGEQRPEITHRPFRLIRPQQGDEVARLHPRIRQFAGQGGRPLGELRPRERHPSPPVHIAFQGDRVGKFRPGFIQQANQGIHARFLPRPLSGWRRAERGFPSLRPAGRSGYIRRFLTCHATNSPAKTSAMMASTRTPDFSH